ncbi:17171_t:CDS:2 [Dentiscutata heterogama]|uniref:17171_t:CDS:1 n=1 Tax=Dentiscutata heterogama TaxID=1316150 RepID=A0ACA9LMP6_9GLOM|nr:17171_t:CDS:2 [Dentiscutata heterogama]
MATSEATDESSKKRHRLFSGNCDEFSSEIEDNQVTTTDITAVTDTSSQISIVTCLSSSKNIPQSRRQPRPFSEVAERDPIYTRKPKKNCVLPNSISQTTMNSHYASDHPLSKAITNQFD